MPNGLESTTKALSIYGTLEKTVPDLLSLEIACNFKERMRFIEAIAAGVLEADKREEFYNALR